MYYCKILVITDGSDVSANGFPKNSPVFTYIDSLCTIHSMPDKEKIKIEVIRILNCEKMNKFIDHHLIDAHCILYVGANNSDSSYSETHFTEKFGNYLCKSTFNDRDFYTTTVHTKRKVLYYNSVREFPDIVFQIAKVLVESHKLETLEQITRRNVEIAESKRLREAKYK